MPRRERKRIGADASDASSSKLATSLRLGAAREGWGIGSDCGENLAPLLDLAPLLYSALMLDLAPLLDLLLLLDIALVLDLPPKFLFRIIHRCSLEVGFC